MKISRLLLTLSALLLANLVGLMAADLSPADRDWQAYEAVVKAPPPKPYKEMSRLEAAQNSEHKTLRLRELGLAFIENHPTDPRRWSVVLYFHPTMPRFVKEWGPLNTEGVPDKPVVDEAAAAAWKAKVAELKAALAQATDVPDDVKKVLAAQADREANQQGFLAKWRSGKTAAPDFTMHDLSGKEVKLADYRGKVVVLDFWATWCGPCKAAMPHTQQLASKHRAEGVVVIASCTGDTRENFEKWVRANQANYPDIIWAFDPAAKSDGRAAKKLYEVSGIPCQFVINREGRVVDVVIGYFKGEVLLDAALAKAGVKIDDATLAQAAADLKKRGG